MNLDEQTITDTTESADASAPSATPSAKDPLGECRICRHWPDIKDRVRVQHLLDTTIDKIERKLTAEEYKPTVAEYLKLLQFEKEIEDQHIDKEVHVKWVGPTTES